MMTAFKSALQGLRIVDFTRVLAGPFCTMLLGDLGADVIKIEHPETGDDTRQWGPPWGGAEADKMSAYFLSVNRNKRSLTLNLKTTEGQALARDLISRADVVIENFKVGQMGAFGLDEAQLRPSLPRLIYCSITGYGQTGPLAHDAGYDYVIQAQSGLMSITGPAEGEPYKVGVAVADVLTGLFAANAIQAALLARERTGLGQQIDIALFDSQIAAMVNVASNFLVSQQAPVRYGNAHPNIVPYQTFAARTGYLIVAVGNDRQFERCVSILGVPHLATDPRFDTNPHRVANREALIPLLQAELRKRDATVWVEALRQAGVPASTVDDVPTALRGEQARARGLTQPVELGNHAVVELIAPTLRLSATPPSIVLPPPLLGEHTEAILAEWLSLSPTDVEGLRGRGVI